VLFYFVNPQLERRELGFIEHVCVVGWELTGLNVLIATRVKAHYSQPQLISSRQNAQLEVVAKIFCGRPTSSWRLLINWGWE
jgi:hypothetical protein